MVTEKPLFFELKQVKLVPLIVIEPFSTVILFNSGLYSKSKTDSTVFNLLSIFLLTIGVNNLLGIEN